MTLSLGYEFTPGEFMWGEDKGFRVCQERGMELELELESRGSLEGIYRHEHIQEGADPVHPRAVRCGIGVIEFGSLGAGLV
jgi:hypothetical protein